MKFLIVFALCVSAVLAEEILVETHEEQVHHEQELVELCKEQGVFANPHDPEHRTFIRCELEPIELQCDDGFIFNEESLMCVEKPQPPAPVDLNAVNWREVLTCPEVEDKYFRNPYDCSKFYRCYTQGEFKRMDPMTCVSTMIFDEVLETCLPVEQFKSLYGVECQNRALPEVRKPEEIPEETIPEVPEEHEHVPEETIPEVPEETIPEVPEEHEHVPEETIPEVPEEHEHVPEETIPEVPEEHEHVPEETIPEVPEEHEHVPEETIPEVPEEHEHVPEETIPEVPEEHIPQEHIPEEHIPEEHIPEVHIPEEHEQVPEEHIPEETLPEEHIPEETLPEEHEQVPEVHVPEQTEEHIPVEEAEKPNLNEILKQIKDLFGNGL